MCEALFRRARILLILLMVVPIASFQANPPAAKGSSNGQPAALSLVIDPRPHSRFAPTGIMQAWMTISPFVRRVSRSTREGRKGRVGPDTTVVS